ncbi:dienelactone hydrolase [Streptomyces sp. 1114.5]|uniref:dienelactone hydrolase family protein n=1 Tax=unclassified Streptomyces TaxID=2593676 RepID=UPI000BCF6151|nr:MULTISPECIES: dienelactone hydrolase family protein [unclassified Streptomyces]RKT18420.1 dienelactone hydrolase [Streptomyces sp. 1114.5]SOB84615.1 Dienelactone hydrolase [Streptomyces sp. 1331.2]
MAQIVLFHSAYGLRPAVQAAADRLRAAGHTVHTPDLFDGRTFDSVEEAQEFQEEIGGRDELLRRAVTASAPLSEGGLVYAGFSLGGAVAQNLALADDKARALLLLHGTSDLREDAATEIPVQLHIAEPDPFEPEDWLNAWYLRMRRAGAEVEVHRYRGAGHLFTDPELPDYDAEAAERAWAAALDFLGELED